MAFFERLLSSHEFMPHGHCYFWKPEMVWLHVLSDATIALAYFTIPVALVFFVRKRRDIPFAGVFLAFGAFIISCGFTHIMEIWTLWTPTYWLSGGLKAVTAAFSVATAILVVRLAPKAIAIPLPSTLALSEARFRAAVHSMADAFYVLDAVRDANGIVSDFRVVGLNHVAAARIGKPLDEVVGMLQSELGLWVRGSAMQKATFRVYETKEPTDEDIELTVPLGAVRWINLRANTFGDSVVIVSRDITERQVQSANMQASVREKEVLLKEIHHRVKNNLQVISSLINMQTRKMNNEQARAEMLECRARIIAISLVHDQLYRSKNYAAVSFSAYAEVLVSNIFEVLGPDGDRVKRDLRLGKLSLPIDRAIPSGLIINELITNALKHAFPNEGAGSVMLEIKALDDGTALIAVSDDGVGAPATVDLLHGDTLGLQLVSTLAEQLGGRVVLDQTKGTKISVIFPL